MKALYYKFFFTALLWMLSNNFLLAQLYSQDAELSQKATDAFAIAFRNADSAKAIAEEVLQTAMAEKNKNLMANALNTLGWAYMHKGRFDSATFFLEKSKSIYSLLHDELSMLRLDINLSEVYTKQGQLSQAITILLEADLLSNKVKNLTHQTDVKRELAIVYREAGDYKKSADYFKQALAGFRQQQDYFHYINTLASLSILYRTTHKYDSSLLLLKEGIQVAKQYDGTPYQQAMLEENMAETYFAKEDYQLALKHYLPALAIFKSLGNKGDIAYESFCIGKTYTRLKRYAIAETYLLQAYNTSNALNMETYKLDASNSLSEMYGQWGRWQQAYKFQQLSIALKDSMNLGEQLKQTTEIKEKYEAEKKESQILLLNVKNRQIKWWFLTGILVVLSAGSSYWLFHYRRRIKEEQIINYFATSLYNQNTVEDVFWDIAKNCISSLGFEDCVIYEFDAGRKILIQKAAYGPKNPHGYIISNLIEIQLGIGIVGHVAESMKAEIIRDTTKDPRYIVDDELRLSEITVPITFEGKLLGVLDSEHSRRNFFTKRHLVLLEKIADICTKKITRRFVEESLRQQIARDLHDNIGSTLSSINILSKLAVYNKGNDEYLSRQMLHINEQTKEMIDSLDDMVWAINPLNDNMASIISKMKEWASEFCEAANIELVFDTEASLLQQPLDIEKRKTIFLIFKEAVNNAVKYSNCTTLQTKFKKIGNQFSMQICDNGIGFNTSKESNRNGLKNMQERAESLKGKLIVESVTGKGTCVLFAIPL